MRVHFEVQALGLPGYSWIVVFCGWFFVVPLETHRLCGAGSPSDGLVARLSCLLFPPRLRPERRSQLSKDYLCVTDPWGEVAVLLLLGLNLSSQMESPNHQKEAARGVG